MKKTIIATIIGGLILFIWQFLSWSFLNVHQAEFKYTDKQDAILACLSEHLNDEGQYMLPTLEPGYSAEESAAFMESITGKPWSQVHYHKSYGMNMPMNLIRGLTINLVAVLLLVWLIMHYKEKTFLKIFLSALTVGAIGYFNFPYLNSIWFEGQTMGYIIDTIAQWGLCGAWLGWWMGE